MAEAMPTLSIVIPTYTLERLRDVTELLDALQAQTYEGISEIVLVVERSVELRDGIEAYLTRKSIPGVRVVFSPKELGICGARNLGVRQTTGDVIAFTDDDAVPFPDWAEQMVRTYKDRSIIGVTGPSIPLWEDESMAWFPREFHWIIGGTAWFDCNKQRETRNAWGVNMSFRREAFARCLFSEDLGISRGFHTEGKLGPVVDDHEFSVRVRRETGKSLLYNPEVKVWHKVYKYRLSPKFIRRQAYWQGYSKAMLSRLYKHFWNYENEFGLLRQIILRLLPQASLQVLTNPPLGIKKISMTARVVFYVALGYLSARNTRLEAFTGRFV